MWCLERVGAHADDGLKHAPPRKPCPIALSRPDHSLRVPGRRAERTRGIGIVKNLESHDKATEQGPVVVGRLGGQHLVFEFRDPWDVDVGPSVCRDPIQEPKPCLDDLCSKPPPPHAAGRLPASGAPPAVSCHPPMHLVL